MIERVIEDSKGKYDPTQVIQFELQYIRKHPQHTPKELREAVEKEFNIKIEQKISNL